jgi:hypothetical protein
MHFAGSGAFTVIKHAIDTMAKKALFQLLILLTVNRSARNGRTEIWRS